MCCIDDCEKPVQAQGLCSKHYNRQYRTGDPLKTRRTYAPDRTCARPECGAEVPVRKRSVGKFCSLECYRASGSLRAHHDRTCGHCEGIFTPSSPSQKYCATCLGPARQMPYGLRYPGGRLLRAYGVSWPEWQQMKSRFDGKCWICRQAQATELDHDHESGKPRGALCVKCNTQLHVVERAGWLKSALDYLDSTTAVVF